jgi:hypothetical protein
MSLLLLHTDWGHSSTLHPVTCPKAHGFWALEREAWVACLEFWREQSAGPRPLALTCGMHVGMRHLVILLTTSALSRTASRRHPTAIHLKSLSRYPIQLRGVGSREELVQLRRGWDSVRAVHLPTIGWCKGIHASICHTPPLLFTSSSPGTSNQGGYRRAGAGCMCLCSDMEGKHQPSQVGTTQSPFSCAERAQRLQPIESRVRVRVYAL